MAVLGGGGGGSCVEAKRMLSFSLKRGPVEILSVDEVNQEMKVATVALVGSPSTIQPYPIPILA